MPKNTLPIISVQVDPKQARRLFWASLSLYCASVVLDAFVVMTFLPSWAIQASAALSAATSGVAIRLASAAHPGSTVRAAEKESPDDVR